MIGDMKPDIMVTFKDEDSKKAFDSIADVLGRVFRNPSYHTLEWEDEPDNRIFVSGLYGPDTAKTILGNRNLIDKIYPLED